MLRERLREIKKKKDDISDTHKSIDQSRPTIVVGSNKSDANDITEILLKVVLNTINLNLT